MTTVAELIAKLQEYPADMPVFTKEDSGYGPVEVFQGVLEPKQRYIGERQIIDEADAEWDDPLPLGAFRALLI